MAICLLKTAARASLLLFCLLALGSNQAARAQDPVSFNRDIRPILSDTCFTCHGPDSASLAAGLRLDLRDRAITEFRPASPSTKWRFACNRACPICSIFPRRRGTYSTCTDRT